MKKLGIWLIGLAVLSAPLALAKDHLSSSQKQEVNQLIQQYLKDNPKAVVESLVQYRQQALQQQATDSQKAVTKHSKQLLTAKRSPELGNPKGDVTVVEFLDYRCGHCREMEKVVSQLLRSDGNIRVVIKQLPIFSGESLLAAKAALAATTQGRFAQVHHALLTTKTPLTKKSIDQLVRGAKANLRRVQKTMQKAWVQQEIDANMTLAKQLKLIGTPAFVVLRSNDASNNVVVPGATSLAKLTQLVAQVRSTR